MSSRSRGRQFAVQILYQHRLSGDPLARCLDLFWAQQEADETTRAFAEELVGGIVDQTVQLDFEISGFLNRWSLDRLAVIDKIILQIGLFELIAFEETPTKVVIDEAVNLTRLFSDDKSISFINGVLHAWSEKNGRL